MSKQENLRRAAIVKMKYQMLAGCIDTGFSIVFEGVLDDLALTAEEVDAYLKDHFEEVQRFCKGES